VLVEERGLLAADGDHWDDRDVVLQRELDESSSPPNPTSPDCQQGL
jgi:hypothetical protein